MSKTPTVLKMIRTLSKLKHKSEMIQELPYGGGNPYYCCSACNRSMIEVSYDGHFNDCKKAALEATIKNYETMLSAHLTKFLNNQEFSKPSFKNFCWFKQDHYVEGLDTLLQQVKEHQKSIT